MAERAEAPAMGSGGYHLVVLPDGPGATDAAEDALIRASQGGSAEAFSRLYGKYRNALYALCLKRLRDPDLAEDVVHDTFLRAFVNLPKFEIGKRMWPWLVTIAERRCLDMYRRKRRSTPVEDVGEAETSTRTWRERRHDATLASVIASEDREYLERALARLPSRQRRALLLHAVDGWKYSDIASAERASVGSVKSLIFRARVTLRAACENAMLGGFVLPIRGLRHRIHRAAERARVAIQLAGDGLAGSAAQSLSTAALALALAFASGAAPGGLGLPGEEGGSSHAPTQRAHLVGSAGARRAAGPAAGGFWNPTDSTDEIARQILDPTDGATPDNTHMTSVAVSPSYERDHTVFALGVVACLRPPCSVLFASHDGGASWTKLTPPNFAADTLLLPPAYPSDPRIYAMGPSGLQESADGGRTFRVVSPLVGGTAISPAFNAADPRILIGTSAVVEYWADRGLMKPAPITAVSGPYSSVAFSPAYPSHPVILVGSVRPGAAGFEAVVSRCSGSLCTESVLPGAVSVPQLRLSRDFATDALIYAFTGNTLFASRDGGASFERRTLPTNVTGSLTDVEPMPGNSRVLFAAATQGGNTRGGLFRSPDGGRSWVRLPLHASLDRGFVALAASPAGRIFAASAFIGMACSDDMGLTWSAPCAN